MVHNYNTVHTTPNSPNYNMVHTTRFRKTCHCRTYSTVGFQSGVHTPP
ncbi:hypothetical protein LINPERHAP2_LOCUS34737 [Linum perenne]